MRKVILIVGLILLVQPRLFAQISYLQSASSVSFTSATGVSVSFTSNTTLGNTIVVAASTAGPAISSVADTQGNTYVQAVASGTNAIWYATSIKGGADTVTANFAASTGFSLIYVHEYAGLATSPLDQVSSQTGTGTAVTSGAKTTTQANELIFGYASVDHCVLSGSTGFSVRQTAGCNMSEDMIVSATGTYAATFTQNISSGWAGLMATFKAASAGPPPTLQSIAVTPANPSISVGSSPLQMAATGTYSDSSMQNITGSCSWTSSATGVATVNSAGQVTPVATGSASIKCTVGSVSGSTTVTVTPAAAAIRYVQSASNLATQNATGVSVSFTSNTTLGNTIVVAASTAGPAISSVADTQGNTYVQAVASGTNAIWYATSIKGGADTVTANFAASTGFSLIYVHEYAGLATSPLDQVSSQTGTGTAVTSGAKTTTQANELIFGYASVDHCVLSGSTGFSVRQTAGCNMSEDMIVSATGTYAATFTQNISSGWAGLMATFKAASAGPPPTLQSIAVTPANPTISVGSSPLQLTATGTYSDSSTQNITSSCAWTSSATGVATVNSAGQVTPVATGSASIKCTVGSVSGSTTVTVTPAAVAIRYVQSASNLSTQNATGVSVSFTSNTTLGNTIVVAASTAGPAISSVVDTQGNTYVQAVDFGNQCHLVRHEHQGRSGHGYGEFCIEHGIQSDLRSRVFGLSHQCRWTKFRRRRGLGRR